MRFLFGTLICGLLVAQQQSTPQQAAPPTPPAQDQKQPDQPLQSIKTTVRNVVAQAVVFDRDDNYVGGIRPDQFRLFDNGNEQNIHVDESFVPISMVIAIQCNGEVDKILPQVNRIGNLMGPLLLGQQGEAAVIAFDSRVRTLQEFTADPDKITAAVKKIQSGSMSAHLIDAVDESIRMLRNRDISGKRRRIILLISESRDQGSMGKGRETLIDLQMNNVMVYAVPMSRLLGKLTAPAPYPRSNNNPPAMTNLPVGLPSTPTTVGWLGMNDGDSAQFIAAAARDLQGRQGDLQNHSRWKSSPGARAGRSSASTAGMGWSRRSSGSGTNCTATTPSAMRPTIPKRAASIASQWMSRAIPKCGKSRPAPAIGSPPASREWGVGPVVEATGRLLLLVGLQLVVYRKHSADSVGPKSRDILIRC